MMDRTTWIDASVTSWLDEHALAIQIDVDASRDVAQHLNIKAMLTIVAFVEGKEFDRVVGAKKPKELLAWLDGVRRGETSLVIRRRSVVAEPADMRARLELARELTRSGKFDEAIAEHVWLWDHMLEHQPSMYGVRLSYFATDLTALADAHEPARLAIGVLRDRAAPSSTGPIDRDDFADWICLNRVLGESARTLSWYDAVPPKDRARLAPLVESDIIPLLIDAERWTEAGALYDEPLTTLENAGDRPAQTAKRNLPTELIAYMREHFRETAAQLLRALLAAGRDAEATAVEQRANELDPSQEMKTALANARAP